MPPLLLSPVQQQLPSTAGTLQAKDLSKVLNWKVVDQSNTLLGFVKEVLLQLLAAMPSLPVRCAYYQMQLVWHCCQVVEPQDALTGSCPVLRIDTAPIPSGQLSPTHPPEPPEQHLIPWVPAIVQRIHAPSHTITITPPAGLLELGRQQHLLDRLLPELMAYGKPAAGSMAERLGQRYMPTKRQLVSAGREDLVKLITSAGGFIHVAHLLGLRAKRKPAGQCS